MQVKIRGVSNGYVIDEMPEGMMGVKGETYIAETNNQMHEIVVRLLDPKHDMAKNPYNADEYLDNNVGGPEDARI